MLFSLELSARMSSNTRNAPAKAAMVTPMVDHPGIALTAVPLRCPVSNTTMATPNPAPLEMPKMEGSAKGFLKRVCIKSPERDRPMPASKAVIA